MSWTLKVLVCSASPDKVNNNAVLRSFVGRGFAELLPAGHVISCSLDYAVDAANRYKPELVVVFGSCMPDSCDYTALRSYCARSGATMVFWLHDDPYEFDFNYKIYQYADFIFSNDKWAVTHIDHPRVFHLPLAADPQTHYRHIRNNFCRDVFFCGVGFQNRQQLLTDCASMLTPYQVDVYGAEWPDTLGFCHNTRIANDVLPDYYSSSLVTLNIGRRFNLANSKYHLDATTPGPRTFEAAMAGAVQCLYFEAPEVEDYFESNTEILLFDTPSELDELLVRLKEDPNWRKSISVATQARAKKDHTYSKRAEKILNLVNDR